ncbi:hypothetical protein Ga0074812_102194 [Parafrankia irregularis]|uniref:Class I SAM-dependent methyltransferase n=1 Tax=Parafrankia irregularis TaxID=795642 RepID=A0A0S4QHH6_9ACTN|nr:hypothetical protein Ga0074812_102194 [Parafrankia irregularis]
MCPYRVGAIRPTLCEQGIHGRGFERDVSGVTVSRRRPRLAAGRARALGLPTRGTTAPNRLRRVDRWLASAGWSVLRRAADPLVVDLGFGSSPVTTVEMYDRLRPVRADVRVVGLELAPERVAAAEPAARPPGLTFARGGFELAGLRPVVIRAMNVLRQYEEGAVESAWAALVGRLQPGGILVEGTCDEIGRRACWFALGPDRRPRSLTFSAHLGSLTLPSDLAPRLPKSLIARNVPGEDVHALLTSFDAAWERSAPRGAFGPRQRWIAAAGLLRRDGWLVLDGPHRWRLGELTVAWPPGPGPTPPGLGSMPLDAGRTRLDAGPTPPGPEGLPPSGVGSSWLESAESLGEDTEHRFVEQDEPGLLDGGGSREHGG